MKVALLTTYKTGGAGVVSQRLARALLKEGVDARMLMQSHVSDHHHVYSTTHSKLDDLKNKVRLAKEILPFVLQAKSKNDRFKFSVANEGIDVTRRAVVSEADLIHLHWINQGFLSLESIHQLKALKKPIIWTMHDMWVFTGGCHHSGRCHGYEKECGYCPYLKNPSAGDLSNKVWKRKQRAFQNLNATFVACSDWLKNRAKDSSLIGSSRIETIPNPIDTERFAPLDKRQTRTKYGLSNSKVILFGAMNLDDENKGFSYLVSALSIVAERYPETKNEIELLVFGKTKNTDFHFPFKITSLGLLSSEHAITEAYSMADVFVLPSLEETLPTTIMESMACGTPVVGFRTGGVPEMIDHLKTGYLAEHRSAEDLAEGIYAMLYHTSPNSLAEAARKKVLNSYAEKVVVKKYIELYQQVLR
jgi:glycosyltransferase involved in cell wall biosynthesis